MVYDYDELIKMIERPLGKENVEEVADDQPMEELYVEFRKYEAQQAVILKHNWSGEDVLFGHFALNRKSTIFKALNRVDKAVWIGGLGGVL
jgi:hypothetical protein